MSAIAEQLVKTKGLLSALDALTNRRAFATLGMTLIGCALLGALLTYLTGSLAFRGHVFLAGLFGLVGGVIDFLFCITGFSATGFILDAQMTGKPQPTIREALLKALATLPRLIGVCVLLFLLVLGIAIGVAVLLLICKIPGIGALLYTLVFPVCVIVTGLTLFSALYITMLAGPAIWNGKTTVQTVALLIAVARQRLLAVVINTLLLGLLVSVVAGIIMFILGVGIGFTSALSLPIIGYTGGLSGLGVMNSMLMGGGSGYAVAALIGSLLLVSTAWVLPMLLAIAGYCLIYSYVTDGLSSQDIEEKLKAAQDKARTSIQQAREQMATAATAATTSASPETPLTCPACEQTIGSDDVFCGNCGHKLK
ncbi:zinc ribbon domain-containing protein [Azonexus sp.]|jgi:hypothetical protein|uniref:zinc ribbon domain-containing protein n=1 Tax=Azonexus sp. TaxID=1872668 RepID=UPI00283353F2|nr:zinc ribbon domain-containing protein [Azonexus sp.]MDR1994733.1 zinc ribbon domain-containing protein [Azonexus sp.]